MVRLKFSKDIARNLTASRESSGMTQKALAEATGIKLARLGRLERAEAVADVDEIINIALALDVPVTNIFYGKDHGLLDVRKHWPRNQTLIGEILRMLRTFEEYVESQWVEYCITVLEPYFRRLFESGGRITKKNAPKPPWKYKNVG